MNSLRRRRANRPVRHHHSTHRFRPSLNRLEARLAPATFFVTTLNDSGPGSLRQAILDANAQPGDDVVSIQVAGTIGVSGDLPALSTNIDMQGPGDEMLTVRGSLAVDAGATVAISGLRVSNPSTMANGISNSGALALTDVTVSGFSLSGIRNNFVAPLSVTMSVTNCTIFENGAGIANAWGTATISDSTIRNNKHGIGNSGTMTLTNSIVNGNFIQDADGGGIYNSGPLTIINSRITGNGTLCSAVGSQGGLGGGILNFETLTVANSIIEGNYAVSYHSAGLGGWGGGVLNYGTATFTDCSISDNSAFNYGSGGSGGRGGGILNSGTLTLIGSILNGNSTNGSGSGIENGRILHTHDTIVADSYSNQIMNADTGTIIGSGTLGGSLVNNGRLNPEGVLALDGNLIDLVGTGSLQIDVNGPSDYDQLQVTGQSTLSGPLNVSLGYAPAWGDSFRVLDSTGTNPIAGQFQGLPDGAILVINGMTFRVSYFGGTGNDVTLTRVDFSPQVSEVIIGPYVSPQRSMITQLKVIFDQIITFGSSPNKAFKLQKIVGGQPVGNVDLVVNTVTDVDHTEATLTFASDTSFGSLNDGRYRLNVIGERILYHGIPMAQDYVVNFHRLFGDANGDNRVDIADYGIFSLSYGSLVGHERYLFYFDYNNDGRIDVADFGQFSLRYLMRLP